MLKDMEEQLKIIINKLKEASNRHKSLAYLNSTPREFKVGDNVFLRVKPFKSVIKSSKLAARFMGSFTIL